ncbi:hypothetical protein Zm00014a_006085 [Zea mays]|uniref:Uncharacterized protein n=1 Tax=Zea mays TaxID=4577 RepID=A0A3L6FP83_MAIZE|nr:hypothetical protein Zm00014a_006085 [Zea mays]
MTAQTAEELTTQIEQQKLEEQKTEISSTGMTLSLLVVAIVFYIKDNISHDSDLYDILSMVSLVGVVAYVIAFSFVPDDDSIDQSDGRIHDDEGKVTLATAVNEYVTSAANNNEENLDITSVQQSEVTRADFLDVTSNTEYNLTSTPDYATSSALLLDSASQSLQENRQFQNISPFSSFMH